MKNLEFILVLISVGGLLTNGNFLPRENLVLRKRANGGALEPSSTDMVDEADDILKKNNDDDSHLRLYYKSNSPGRTISHELEHRFVKNPNYRQYNHHRLIQETNNNLNGYLNQPGQQYQLFRGLPATAYDPRLNLMNRFRLNQNTPQSNYRLANQYPIFWPGIDRNPPQPMHSLHNHGNLFDNYQSMVKSPYQQAQFLTRNNNLARMMLLNGDQPQTHGFPLPQLNTGLLNEANKNENGLQYKIVHMKLKIEPQQGRLIGQSLVENDLGAGPVFNSHRFTLMPQDLPNFMRRLLDKSPQLPLNYYPPTHHYPTHSSLFRKREFKDDRFAKRSPSEDENESDAENKYDRRSSTMSDMERIDADEDKINDSELNESLRNLQKRGVVDESSEEAQEISTRGESDEEVPEY